MAFVLTLIAAKSGGLTARHIEHIQQHFMIENSPDILSPGKAVDFFFDTCPLDIKKEIASQFDNDEIDLFLQSIKNRRKKLFLADMDSTIIQQETLDELGKIIGKDQEISMITELAMNGKLDFSDALKARASLLKGTSFSKILEVRDHLRLTSGAEVLLKTLQKNHVYCVLVSGGFDVFVNQIAERLNFNQSFGNQLIVQNNSLTGDVVEPIFDKNGKLNVLQEMQKTQNLTRDDVLAVGDGANDIPMLNAAGMGVAFHAKPIVQAMAPHSIRFGDLTTLLYSQGYHEHEFCVTH